MMTANNPPQFKTLSGVIERITYQNEENGYTIARLLPENTRDGDSAPNDARGNDNLITIIGTLLGVAPGEALELRGFWQRHSQHGWQFKVENYRSVLPATAQGIRKYLGSGLIKGIGPRTADKIVDHFGVDTLDILEHAPDRLSEVPRLGAHKSRLITAAWEEQRAIKEVMVFLHEHEISTSLAVRIYKQYHDAAISVVRNQPYRLAREVWGIGFKTADKIAQSLGFALDDPERIRAGALHVLSEASDEGHTYLPRPQLAEKATELLAVNLPQVQAAIDGLAGENGAHLARLINNTDGSQSLTSMETRAESHTGQVSEERAPYVTLELFGTIAESISSVPLAEQVVYLWPFYMAEQNVARNLRRLANCPPYRDRLAEFGRASFAVMFDYLAEKQQLRLSERQQEGVKMALAQMVGVITGGPGTGKTTSMRALISALIAQRKSVVLAAPTGRAAKRLSEATGLEAKTLHRLLQIKPGGKAFYDQDNTIPADIVIVDECSMIDILLMNTLLKAVASGTHLLLVGDADQLPSVGAGNVLADIIASGIVPVVKLNQIFRQAADSAIVTNAHLINQGQMPRTGAPINDFFFFVQEDPEQAAELVVDLVTHRIPAKFGYSPADIQVLVPTHRGKCGVAALNEALQAALNPERAGRPQKQFGGRTLRSGDKVLQLCNNYDKDVFNGDTGIVTAINLEDQYLKVQLEDGRNVDYDFSELDQITLAYAMSIHKAQGSEYPVCVIPLLMQHYMLLERKLVYTAVTRARKIVVMVGSKRALAMAVKNGPEQPARTANLAEAQHRRKSGRFSGLAIRLAQP
ncbi:MAG: ATP-dependent RecD-like DNA helicase [Chloroflexi bacterium]|nr:ATP-dependent RecD-like DNA helicase [Chloroflexota bacterium]